MAAGFTTTSTPHLTPPLTTEELTDWLRLLRSRRVGISTFFRLLSDHGSAAAALDALPGIAREAGVEDYQPFPRADAEAELEAADRAGAQWIAFGTSAYPTLLSEIPDPPPLLAVLGDVAILNRPAVAVIGARNASSLGTRMARKLATDLGHAGQVVVSGLARGIDTAAHVAALDTGTIAVMAGGIDVIYPAENAVLAREISEKGALVTEQPMHMRPQARHFPRRNRLISGLSAATVVVEAAARSGSLATARTALDQGRDVLAVPGHPFDARATGCNFLIRDGAHLVRGADDVLSVLRPAASPAPGAEAEPETLPFLPEAPAPRRTQAETAALHTEILARLGPSPLPEDQLIRDLARSVADVSPELLKLELDGRIRRQPGGLLSLTA